MTSSMKIFRPWASAVGEDELVRSKRKIADQRVDAKNLQMSVYSRVPEPGYPIAEFAAGSWHGLPVAFEDCWSSAGVQVLPYQTADSLAHSLSYLDPAYLDVICGSAKVAKLKQRPKKFRCPHCKVSFSNNGQLKGHVRIHTGERPFKCDAEKCGKSFTRNEELTRHKRIHTGLRPFPCDQCGKRFGRKDHLKKHVRTHYPQPRFLDANLVSLYPVLFGY